MRSRVVTPHSVAAVLLVLTIGRGAAIRADVVAGTRAEGLRLGPHAVGFEVVRGIDRRRRINASDGTLIGMAIWYPARPPAAGTAGMTSMEYRLLERSTPPSPVERQTLEAEEVDALVGWRHVGIVPLTPEQAKASLETRGIAALGAVAQQGQFPVVMVLGGPYYLSTTAEVLASHGRLVVAPFRFSDQSNELETGDFRWFMEDSVGDAQPEHQGTRQHRRWKLLDSFAA